MKRYFLMLFFVVFSIACGDGGGTTLIENNGANNGDNNGENNGENNGDNNGVGPNNVLRTNNFTGDLPDLTSDVPVVQFGYDFYLEICKRFIECRDTITIAQSAEGGIATTASCVETLVNRDHPLRWGEALDSSRVTYDDSKKAACLSALPQISCDDLAATVPNPKYISACTDVIVGVGATGDECRSAIDCSGDLVCDGCPGECQIASQLACGDADCQSDEFCNESEVCEKLHGKDEDCANFSQCAAPFACVAGTCTEPKVGAAGDNCVDDYTICGVGYYCDSFCRAYKQIGEDCSNNFCERPLTCDDSNECVRAKETGSCEASSECISFNCINGSCLAPADLCLLK